MKTRKEILDHIYYELGRQSTNFRLTSARMNKGKAVFSKWVSYLKLQEKPKLMEKANQREQLKNEIILDLDKGDMQSLLKSLRNDDIKFYAFATEKGRAQHVHTYWKGLAELEEKDRKKYRQYIIEKYNCDSAFIIDAHQIPLEFTPHWKTGDIKQCVDSDKGVNDTSTIQKAVQSYFRTQSKKKQIESFVFNEEEVMRKKIFPFLKLNEETAGFGMMLPKDVSIQEKKRTRETQISVPVIITFDAESGVDLIELGESFEKKYKIKIDTIPEEDNYERRWSLPSLKKFLLDEYESIDGKELLNEIVAIYEKFLYFANPAWYKVHALWDIGTYFFLLSYYYPLMELRGLKGTAKSKIMTVSRLISFNATEEMTNPSEATLFRETHDRRPTKYIDEAEKLYQIVKGKVESDPRAELINSGYKYTGTVPRQEKFGTRFRTIYYHTYSPTMIASINGLFGATEDRAIVHTTQKPPENDSRGQMEPEESDPYYQEIRDKLYVYALQNWRAVEKRYHDFCIETKLRNRDLNLWKMLLVLAEHIDESILSEVISLAERQAAIKSIDNIPEGSMQQKVLSVVHELIREGYEPILVKDIVSRYPAPDDKMPANKTIARQMDKIFREYKGHFEGGTGYSLSRDIFEGTIMPLCPAIFSSLRSGSSASRTKSSSKADLSHYPAVEEVPMSEESLKEAEPNPEGNEANEGNEGKTVIEGQKSDQKSQIIRWIRDQDSGSGVKTQSIIDQFKDESLVNRSLTHLKSLGDVFQPKPDTWKVLE